MSNYTKLKTNLKLAIQRLKLLEKKKTELSLKSRKEIADYLAINKADRARIRVEHIIREDNYVEAMEMIEMFCDLLLARFGLIEKMKELDPGLDEAIATVIWASPRISNDIQEFKIIGEIFAHKYGKKYAESCKVDALNNVNEKVKRRLGLEPPSKLLVEQYLVEIAKNFNIQYQPDQQVMLRSGHLDQDLINLIDKTNEITRRYGGDGANNNSGGSGGAAAAISNNIGFDNLEKNDLIKFEHDDHLQLDEAKSSKKSNLSDDTINGGMLSHLNGPPPPLPKSLPYGHSFKQPPPPYNSSNILNTYGQLGLNYDNKPDDNNNFDDNNHKSLPPYDNNNTHDPIKRAPNDDELFGNNSANAPPLPTKNTLNENVSNESNLYGPPMYDQNSPSSYNQQVNLRNYPPPTTKKNLNLDDDLGLPSVPTDNYLEPTDNSNGKSQGNNTFDSPSLDFDELSKRFQNLKSQK